jgi:hypothetical protein
MSIKADDVKKERLISSLQHYPTVVKRAYERRIKAEKKQVEAIERDKWRYEVLPQEVKSGKGITLEQLERLVQWKM